MKNVIRHCVQERLCGFRLTHIIWLWSPAIINPPESQEKRGAGNQLCLLLSNTLDNELPL